MRFALEETVIQGMGNNQRYLWTLAKDPEVRAGRMHTGYLGQRYANFAPEISVDDLELIAAARSIVPRSAQGERELSAPQKSPWFMGGAG
jgi:acetyl/propionyl-CoA carboxylase alpha subunit